MMSVDFYVSISRVCFQHTLTFTITFLSISYYNIYLFGSIFLMSCFSWFLGKYSNFYCVLAKALLVPGKIVTTFSIGVVLALDSSSIFSLVLITFSIFGSKSSFVS